MEAVEHIHRRWFGNKSRYFTLIESHVILLALIGSL